MGNFSSQLLRRKGDDRLTLNECKQLREVRSAATGNAAGKAINEPFSQETSGLAFLTRKEDREDSTTSLDMKVEDGRMITFETTPVRYATVCWKGLPLYKELRELAKKHGAILKDLFSELKLIRMNLSGFQTEAELIRIREGKPMDDPMKFFPPLKTEDTEDVEEVFNALCGDNSHEILVTHEPSNIVISKRVLQCLKPGAWLNDEVINLYLELLKERERREHKKFLKCHFFNTFFFKKLTNGKNGYDFRAVRRWTTKKKLGYTLLECDKVFVPIHKDRHWCLAVINIKDKTLQFLDSLGGMDTYVLKILERYLMEETRDKNDTGIASTSWKKEPVNDVPLQKNGWDCGMFMIKYADFYSRGLKPCFSQEENSHRDPQTESRVTWIALDELRVGADFD